MTGFSDTFLSKLSGADCASLRLSSANVLFYKAVACGFAAIPGENPIENPRVRGSIPRLPPEYKRLPSMEAVFVFGVT